MEVVLSKVLDFDSFGELAAACAECIENNGLTSEDKGVPSDWDNADVWGPDEVEEFLKFNSSIFIQDQGIEPKIRVEIE